MKKYRKRPVVIEAVQYDGTNNNEVIEWIKSYGGEAEFSAYTQELLIRTLEGVMRANKGDYVIKGVHGEFYPCKPDIFNETYEEI